MKTNPYIMQVIALTAQAQAGAELFSNNLKQRALDKWEKSKQLPRKQKKLMRKDACLDFSIAQWNEEFSNNLFNF